MFSSGRWNMDKVAAHAVILTMAKHYQERDWTVESFLSTYNNYDNGSAYDCLEDLYLMGLVDDAKYPYRAEWTDF